MYQEILRESLSIPITGESAPIDCYISRPAEAGTFPAVIVGMELFGVNEHIRDVTDRVARSGYVAIAPNFYHRSLPNKALPFGEAGRNEGFEHLHQLCRATVLIDVCTVMKFLSNHPSTASRTGFLGFSMGGHIAYLAATQFDIAACACFYGGWIVNTDIELSRPQPTVSFTQGIADHGGKVIYFAGGKDHAVTSEQRELLEAALVASKVRHEMVLYPHAQHGFFCERRDTFDEASRDDAWARVLELFAQELH